MTDQQRIGPTTPSPAHSRRYQVKLDSRDGKVVYVKSMAQKQILESAERIIAKANKKMAQ